MGLVAWWFKNSLIYYYYFVVELEQHGLEIEKDHQVMVTEKES